MEVKDARQSSGGAAIIAIIVLALTLLPLVYVASVGPAVWLMERGYVSPDSRMTLIIYWPLEALAERSPAVMNGLTWYADLFRQRQAATTVQ